jgi:hypothetical protein
MAGETATGATAGDAAMASRVGVDAGVADAAARTIAEDAASTDLVVQGGAYARVRAGASRATSSRASSCSAGQLLQDWARADLADGEVSSGVSPAPGDQTVLVLFGSAVVGPAMMHELFTDYRQDLVAFSKGALSKLYHVEKFVAVNA